MFLTRTLDSSDIARFNEGFPYYWDVFTEMNPHLFAVLETLAVDPMVQQTHRQYEADTDLLRPQLVKLLTFLIYVLGEENAEVLLDVVGASHLACSLIPMVAIPINMDPDGPIARNNIVATLLATVIDTTARGFGKDADGVITRIMRELRLPGYVYDSIRKYLKSPEAKQQRKSLIH